MSDIVQRLAEWERAVAPLPGTPAAMKVDLIRTARTTIEDLRGALDCERRENAELVAAFKELGVDQARLEAKIGAKKGTWTAANVADMLVIHKSITRDGESADALIPPLALSAADLGQPELDGVQP